MATGIVKYFDPNRGFGFLATPESTVGVYVHYSQIRSKGPQTLTEGERVEFQLGWGPKGPVARNVFPLFAAAPGPSQAAYQRRESSFANWDQMRKAVCTDPKQALTYLDLLQDVLDNAREGNPFATMAAEAVRTCREQIEDGLTAPQQQRTSDAPEKAPSAYDLLWEKRFTELKAYKERFGDCAIPARWPENTALAAWVLTQRVRRKKMRPDRIARLDALGFVWDSRPEAWESHYSALADFKSKHGHTLVSQDDREFPGLGSWVSVQRRKRKQLFPDQRERLDALGMAWDVVETKWRLRYEELKRFHEKYGHCDVPEDAPEYADLCAWLRTQRTQRKFLPEERRGLLEALGFQWRKTADRPDVISAREKRWRENYEKLLAFHYRFGHCRVSWKVDEALAHWTSHQRAKADKLSARQIKLLDDIGFFHDRYDPGELVDLDRDQGSMSECADESLISWTALEIS